MTDAMDIGTGIPPFERSFRSALDGLHRPKVLEIGTFRWEPDRPTHHRDWAPGDAEYVMSDISYGLDVDVVADAHFLSDVFEPASFDAVIAISVWEHLRRPWVAAAEVTRILRPGGLLFVLTHHTFPVHGYPNDYYRFSTEALADLFDEPQYSHVETGYGYPAMIVPPAEVTRWNPSAEAWLNVGVYAIRSGGISDE